MPTSLAQWKKIQPISSGVFMRPYHWDSGIWHLQRWLWVSVWILANLRGSLHEYWKYASTDMPIITVLGTRVYAHGCLYYQITSSVSCKQSRWRRSFDELFSNRLRLGLHYRYRPKINRGENGPWGPTWRSRSIPKVWPWICRGDQEGHQGYRSESWRSGNHQRAHYPCSEKRQYIEVHNYFYISSIE